jgi:hypothetical protein
MPHGLAARVTGARCATTGCSATLGRAYLPRHRGRPWPAATGAAASNHVDERRVCSRPLPSAVPACRDCHVNLCPVFAARHPPGRRTLLLAMTLLPLVTLAAT